MSITEPLGGRLDFVTLVVATGGPMSAAGSCACPASSPRRAAQAIGAVIAFRDRAQTRVLLAEEHASFGRALRALGVEPQ